MTTYERRVIETRRVEFVVPARPPYGAPLVEIEKAVSGAVSELKHGVGDLAFDDAITVTPTDEAVVISYELSQRIDDKCAGKAPRVTAQDVRDAWAAWDELSADQQYPFADSFEFYAARLNGTA